jgi:hypothetical protein
MKSVPNRIRPWCTALLFCAATTLPLVGQASEPDWLTAARVSCAADYDDERCEDQQFLQQEYAPETIAASREIARKAAVRKNRAETQAMREVLVKHTGLCDQKPAQYCPPNNLAACTQQLQQTCATIKRQVAMCEAQTERYCAQHRGGEKCMAMMERQCDNQDQSLDQILAKYPDLSPSQKAKLKQIALQLEQNKDRALLSEVASNFLTLLGYGLAL